jgi:hypothetical protein
MEKRSGPLRRAGALLGRGVVVGGRYLQSGFSGLYREMRSLLTRQIGICGSAQGGTLSQAKPDSSL